MRFHRPLWLNKLHSMGGPVLGLAIASVGIGSWISQAQTSSPASPPLRSTARVTTSVIRTFEGLNGANPLAGLVQGKDGNFYGTTSKGGRNNLGIVFRFNPIGNLATLDTFTGANGANPQAELIQASDGRFYGTTSRGGSRNLGTVFRIPINGRVFTLVNFNRTNGAIPLGGLVQGTNGRFFGTTSQGGSSNLGIVFSLTNAGVLLPTLVNFNGNNGATPRAGLIQGTDGRFYGTTSVGGRRNLGTAFRVTTAGTFNSFAFGSGNVLPPAVPPPSISVSELVQGKDGNFYGTSSTGGLNNLGTIFRMTSAGTISVLFSFNGQGANGANPQAPLTVDSSGNLYGTTFQGGRFNRGTVFVFNPSTRNFNTLHTFSGGNGAFPRGALVQANSGTFYGTTSAGGRNNLGVIFRMVVP